MSIASWLMIAAAYLAGAIPFGYLIGRLRGVNLFTTGSGNIGATNVGRVLGWKFGLLCFSLDLLKGSVPVVVAKSLLDDPLTPTLTAAAAFIGHLFPITLGFRGGKGVATGAGTVLMLTPIPALAAFLGWILVLLTSRTVSLASILAVVILCSLQLTTAPLTAAPTIYVLTGTIFVVLKHRSNIGRLLKGTENQIGEFTMRQPLLRVLHLIAIGLWFGGAAFFNFAAAPTLFRTFPDVVATAPSDRTAFLPLLPNDATSEKKKDLGNALFGAAVGPIFPVYFLLSAICSTVVFVTAWAWRRDGRVHRWRFGLALMAVASVAAGWWISAVVTDLRLARFDPNPDVAAYAKTAFGSWHLVSLALSIVTVALAGAILVLAAWLPQRDAQRST